MERRVDITIISLSHERIKYEAELWRRGRNINFQISNLIKLWGGISGIIIHRQSNPLLQILLINPVALKALNGPPETNITYLTKDEK